MLTKTICLKNDINNNNFIALLVQTANQFESKIIIKQENANINMKSIMGMLTLDINNLSNLELNIDGKDEEDAMENILKFLKGEY